MNDSNELKKIVAKNICTLRQKAGLTQNQLGEKLCYSDKAISKWERGEAIPDAFVLMQISKLFDISIDDLLSDLSQVPQMKKEEPLPTYSQEDQRLRKKNHIIIFMITMLGIWTLAMMIFIILWMYGHAFWDIFLYTIPVSLIVALVLNSCWGRKKTNLIIVSALCHSILLCVVFILHTTKALSILCLMIPVQIIVSLGFSISRGNEKERIKRLQSPKNSELYNSESPDSDHSTG